MKIIESVMYWNGPAIHMVQNLDLINNAKSIEKKLSPEFRSWWIKFKSTCGSLYRETNEWWYKPAMKLRYPDIKFLDEE